MEIRSALTPVERPIEDARALIQTDDLPDEVARRVVPGFCRLSIEAACIEAVRRRRIGRGDGHAEVETLLASVNRLTVFAALALFDDADRGGDVLGGIRSNYGAKSVTAFKESNRGAHEPTQGDLAELVRDAASLSRQLAERV